MLAPLKIFCCHAYEDSSYFKKLKNHLMPLQFQKHIDLKNEADIQPGNEQEKMLQEHLAEARIILLLISPDFIASNYAEILQAIQYHNQNVATVIPILIRPIFWKDAPFAHLNLLPTNNKAVSSWTFEDEALSQIAEEISKTVIELRIQQFEAEAKLALYPQSLELYEYIIQFLRPDYGKAYEYMGDLYYSQEKYEEALHHYEQAETLDESITIPLRKKAPILAKLQRYNESLDVYKQALVEHESEWQIRAEMAEIYLQTGNLEAALNLYQEILLLQPGMNIYFAKAGDLFFRLLRYEQALKMYKSALELDPLVVSYLISLGDTYYKLGKHTEALKAYQQAIHLQETTHYVDDGGNIFPITKIDGPFMEFHLNTVYYKRGQLSLILHSYEKAFEYFDKVKNSGYAHYYKSQALKALDRYEEALEETQKAIALSSDSCDPRFLEQKRELLELLAQEASKQAQKARIEWIKGEKISFVPESITLFKEFTASSDLIYCLAITPDGKRLFSGSDKGSIKEWQTTTGLFQYDLTGHSHTILNLEISSNGMWMASSSFKGSIKLWDLRTLQGKTITKSFEGVYTAAFSHDGTMIASNDNDYTIKLWEQLPQQTQPKTLSISSAPLISHLVAITLFSLDNQNVFIGHPSGIIEKIALKLEAKSFRIQAHSQAINALKICPDNQMLVSCGTSPNIHVWDTQTGKHLKALNGHTGTVYELAIHPDGQLLVSRSQDGTIRYWNLKTGELLYTMDNRFIKSMVFSPTEPLLYTGCTDGKIRVWSLL